MSLNEFSLIEKYFAGFGQGPEVVLGVGDDAAVLRVPEGEQLVSSVDTLNSGVHFPKQADPGEIAQRALRVNLSDLAAMGAKPIGFTLALSLPEVKEAWLSSFSSALAAEAAGFQCPLVGGDTTAGSLAISVNVFGSVPAGQALLRSGARVGDAVYVTGNLGDAAAALTVIDDSSTELGSSESKYLLDRFYRPLPRLQEGITLRGLATAAVDVSDGLLADLGHIARRSGVGAEVYSQHLPLSNVLKALPNQQQVTEWALTGGDDYELCFTVPERQVETIEAMIALGELDATAIGRMIEGSGVICRDQQGQPLSFDNTGYQHF